MICVRAKIKSMNNYSIGVLYSTNYHNLINASHYYPPGQWANINP